MPRLNPCPPTQTHTHIPHTLQLRCKQSGSAPGNTIPELPLPSGWIYTEQDVFQCILLLLNVCVCVYYMHVCICALPVCLNTECIYCVHVLLVCLITVVGSVSMKPSLPCNLHPFSSPLSTDLWSRNSLSLILI